MASSSTASSRPRGGEADKIVDAGIASQEDVDKAMITGRNRPAGFYGSRGGGGPAPGPLLVLTGVSRR